MKSVSRFCLRVSVTFISGKDKWLFLICHCEPVGVPGVIYQNTTTVSQGVSPNAQAGPDAFADLFLGQPLSVHGGPQLPPHEVRGFGLCDLQGALWFLPFEGVVMLTATNGKVS